jgi:putative membrane protein
MGKFKKIAALALTCSLVLGNAVTTMAVEPNTKEKEEVVYVGMDAAGQITDINVVNIFGSGETKDYGKYTAVKMLNTTDELKQSGDTVSFTSDAEKVYYQGTMAKDTQIPWNINIRYELDGKEITPSDLAGKSGKLKIYFDVSKNEDCEGNFYDSYALQSTFTLDTARCTNIVADGATVANVGSDKQINYTVIPGNGINAVISADVVDFEMDAVSVNGVKLGLDVDVDGNEIKDKVQEAKDATNKLNDGAGELYNGAAELSDGGSSLNDGMETLYSGVEELDNGIADLQTGVASFQEGLISAYSGAVELQNGLSAGLSTSGAGNELSTLISTNSSTISALQDVSSTLAASLTAITDNATAQTVQAQKAQVDGIITLLQTNNSALETVSASMSKLSQLSGGINSLTSGLGTLNTKYVQIVDGVSSLADGSRSLLEGTGTLKDGTSDLYDGIVALRDGILELKDGTTEFSDRTGDAESEAEEKVGSILDNISETPETVSFVSSDNTNVSSVQFVIKTTAIEKPEAEEAVNDTTEQLSFWQKLKRLFKK